MTQNIVILGAQWGDEGKGKVVDLFTVQAQYVVRYQGGNNAGHTIIANNKKIILHLVPSGILHDHVINIIASGVVLSPKFLMEEINFLKKSNVPICDRIFISESCSLIFPYHIAMDIAREKHAKSFYDTLVIGTTGRGIGPAYEDKVARRAIRVIDLYNQENFKNKLKYVLDYYNFQLIHYYHAQPIKYDSIINEMMPISDFLIKMVTDVPKLLENSRKRGDKVIFEGAQGSLLDVNYGTYPYVTSTNTTAGGVIIGTGIGPSYIDYILGIIKSYSTRVGFGFFPTELSNDISNRLCEKGNEFGSTTGRRRRIGWFDSVSVRHAIRTSSINSCCLTKIDVLDGLEEVKICVAYQMSNGEITYDFSRLQESNSKLVPIYEILPGWSESTMGVTKFDQLPKQSQYYIKRIEEVIGIPIDLISTGADRSMMIELRKNPLL